MADHTDSKETLLHRWSRRKLERKQTPAEARIVRVGGELASAQAAGAHENPAARAASDGFDLDALCFESDYARFMSSDVPEVVRTRALRHLWASSDIISRPDDLDDYLEDLREEAMALPAELAKSAS